MGIIRDWYQDNYNYNAICSWSTGGPQRARGLEHLCSEERLRNLGLFGLLLL